MDRQDVQVENYLADLYPNSAVLSEIMNILSSFWRAGAMTDY